eukprot:scaffold3422_cov150-Amphora_coffeaeformis.AAC.2
MRFDRKNIAFPRRHEVEEVVLVLHVVRVVSRNLQTLSNLGNQIGFRSKSNLGNQIGFRSKISISCERSTRVRVPITIFNE